MEKCHKRLDLGGQQITVDKGNLNPVDRLLESLACRDSEGFGSKEHVGCFEVGNSRCSGNLARRVALTSTGLYVIHENRVDDLVLTSREEVTLTDFNRTLFLSFKTCHFLAVTLSSCAIVS